MKYKVIFLMILSIFSSHGFAQGEFVVEYDLENETFHKVSGKIDEVEYILPGYNTYDENNGIFFFISSQPNRTIYGIRMEDGSQIYSVPAASLRSIEYSNSLDKLFGIESDLNSDTKSLVHIDLLSGDYAYIGMPFSTSSSFQGYDSFSDKDTLYTFTSPSNTLYSIHAVTGEIIHQPGIAKPSGHAVQQYDYHQETGVLYAIMSESGGAGIYLAKLNNDTGELTKIGTSKTDLNVGGGGAVNKNENQYLHFYRKSGFHWIAALSLESGEVEYTVPFSVENGDNLIDFEYDNKRDKMYSKHWDSIITSSDDIDKADVAIYPNPTSKNITISNLPKGVGVIFDIYDGQGEKVFNAVVVEQMTIQLDHLPSGIYFYTLSIEDHTIRSGKFIKVKE